VHDRLGALRALLEGAGLPQDWRLLELRRLAAVEAHAARRPRGASMDPLFEDLARDLERVALNVAEAHLAALEALLDREQPNAAVATTPRP
jgi:hypothetical protein